MKRRTPWLISFIALLLVILGFILVFASKVNCYLDFSQDGFKIVSDDFGVRVASLFNGGEIKEVKFYICKGNIKELYNATLNIAYDKWDLPFVILIAAFAAVILFALGQAHGRSRFGHSFIIVLSALCIAALIAISIYAMLSPTIVKFTNCYYTHYPETTAFKNIQDKIVQARDPSQMIGGILMLLGSLLFVINLIRKAKEN